MVFKAGLTAAGHKRVCECTCVRMCVCMRARVSVRPRVYACACVCARVRRVRVPVLAPPLGHPRAGHTASLQQTCAGWELAARGP